MRTIVKEMKQLTVLGKEELVHEAKELQAPLELVRVGGGERQAAGAEFFGGRHCYAGGRGAGDAAWARKRCSWAREFSSRPIRSARAKAIVKAATYYKDPEKLLEASEELGEAMPGLEISKLPRRVDADARLVGRWDNETPEERGSEGTKIGVLALQGDFEAHAQSN